MTVQTDFLDAASVATLLGRASAPLVEIAGSVQAAFSSRLGSALARLSGAIAPEPASVTLRAHRGTFQEAGRERSHKTELSFVYIAPGGPIQRLRIRDPKGIERTVPAPPNSLVVFAAGLACELLPARSHPMPLVLRGSVSRHSR